MTPAPPPCEPLTFSFLLRAADALTANRDVHHQVRARRVREIRETVRHALRNPHPMTGLVNIDCALTWGDNRHRDAPNWAPTLKPAVDELVTLGILRDDSGRYVHKTSMWATDSQPGMKGYVRFIVTLRPVEMSLVATERDPDVGE